MTKETKPMPTNPYPDNIHYRFERKCWDKVADAYREWMIGELEELIEKPSVYEDDIRYSMEYLEDGIKYLITKLKEDSHE